VAVKPGGRKEEEEGVNAIDTEEVFELLTFFAHSSTFDASLLHSPPPLLPSLLPSLPSLQT